MTGEPAQPGWRRPLIGWGLVLLGIFAFQSAAARRMYIPSESMMPTLLTGDHILVTKYPYGWSYASLALRGSATPPGRLFGRYPERGDIVTVVRRGDGADLIKRVIGLPGDTVEMRRGLLFLNDRMVKRESRGRAMLPVDANLPCDGPLQSQHREEGADGKLYCRLPIWRETLPNGVRYDTVDLGRYQLGGGYVSPRDNYGPVRVPEGHVFLMGDNRDQSADSRVDLEDKGLGGAVPFETISGRAEIITNSYDGSGSWLNPISWVTTLRGDRAWTGLRPGKATD